VRAGSKGAVVVASGSAAKGGAARATVKPQSNVGGAARVTPVVPKLNFSALWSMDQEEEEESGEGLPLAPRAAQQGADEVEDVDLGVSSPAAGEKGGCGVSALSTMNTLHVVPQMQNKTGFVWCFS
jgi:hypothetical protein